MLRRTLMQLAAAPFLRVVDLPVWAVRCKACSNMRQEEHIWVREDGVGWVSCFPQYRKPQLVTRTKAQEWVSGCPCWELVFLPQI